VLQPRRGSCVPRPPDPHEANDSRTELVQLCRNSPALFIDPFGLDKCKQGAGSKSCDDEFERCLNECLKELIRLNTQKLGNNLKRSATVGPIAGVGICGAIVVFEPYLGVAFPKCVTVAGLSTAGVMGVISVQVWNIENLASIAGCAMSCGGLW